jgi:triosephosphate isomerase (TIM)
MKYFVANWKMNMSTSNMYSWLEAWSSSEKNADNKEIIVAPSYVHLPLVKAQLPADLKISAQDVSEFDNGAHTGQISAKQLTEFCRYCIVGHSELTYTQDQVTTKAQQCLKNGLTPIICFKNPHDVEKYYIEGAIMAWEDPQNISQNGQYQPTDTQQIAQNLEKIKSLLPNTTEILYGGSVNIENIAQLKTIPTINGFLVGNASLDSQHFINLINA